MPASTRRYPFVALVILSLQYRNETYGWKRQKTIDDSEHGREHIEDPKLPYIKGTLE